MKIWQITFAPSPMARPNIQTIAGNLPGASFGPATALLRAVNMLDMPPLEAPCIRAEILRNLGINLFFRGPTRSAQFY
jgi:hypothetical protein